MSIFLTKEWLRVHIGLGPTDTAKDLEIEAAMAAALAIADTFCNRKFAYAEDAETFTHFRNSTLTLRRYPISEVTDIMSVTDPSLIIPYHVESLTGLLHLDGFFAQHEVTLMYVGGYWMATPPAPPGVTICPDDLAIALVYIFDEVWKAQNSTIAGGGVSGLGDARQIRAGDLAITYDNGNAGDSVEHGFGELLPLSAAGILLYYRRQTA